MGIIANKVFRVEYKNSRNESNAMLIEADDIPEAVSIFKEKYPNFEITTISTYIPVYRKTTKTVTIDL